MIQKRRFQVSVAVVALAICVRASGQGANNAVTYQINTSHNGVQVDPLLRPPFVRRWQVTLPGPASYPLIADGLVFVTVAGGGASHPTLYALNQASGATVWSHQLPGGFSYPWAAAAYDRSRVFAVDTSGVMTAYDAPSGALLWTESLPLQYLFSSPPTAANGIVYVGGAGSGGTVYAVDEVTGTVLATQSVQNGDHSSPALSQSSVFVSYACNQAYGFAQGTLASLWYYSGPCEGGGGKTTAYENGRVFTRDFTGNLILDASSGALLGQYAASAIPAARGNTVWVRHGNTLSAQDVSSPSSPTTSWSFTGDGQLASAPVVIAVASDTFVVEGSSTGMLYALDAITGTPVWSTNIGASVPSPDEQNISQPLTGFGAGQGLLVIPAGNTVSAFVSSSTPIPALSAAALAGLAALLASLATIAIGRRP